MSVNQAALELIQEVIEGCAGQIKWSGLSAIRHLATARELADKQPEMAAFSAICAEEEASAALIHSLKCLKYPQAKKIKFTSHPHKHAVFVFVRAVIEWFKKTQTVGDWPFHPPVFGIKTEGKRKALNIKLPLKGMELAVEPHPPLNLGVSGATTIVDMLKAHLIEYMAESNIHNLRVTVEKSAGIRNGLLYATSNGLPKLSHDIDKFIDFHLEKVVILLAVVGLVDPWCKHPHAPIVVTSIAMLLEFMDRTCME